MMSDIRSVIRQILLEELRHYDGALSRNQSESAISIASSRDLNAFALKVLDIASRRDLRNDIQSGSFQFVLDNGRSVGSTAATGLKSPKSASARIEKNFVSERDIAKLAADVTHLIIGERVCFTPLAKDEIRRRGIRIERKPS